VSTGNAQQRTSTEREAQSWQLAERGRGAFNYAATTKIKLPLPHASENWHENFEVRDFSTTHFCHK
jgi:hypothetical protein